MQYILIYKNICVKKYLISYLTRVTSLRSDCALAYQLKLFLLRQLGVEEERNVKVRNCIYFVCICVYLCASMHCVCACACVCVCDSVCECVCVVCVCVCALCVCSCVVRVSAFPAYITDQSDFLQVRENAISCWSSGPEPSG